MSTITNPVSAERVRSSRITADSLNRGCTCPSLNAQRLSRELDDEPSLSGLVDEIANNRPNLFSAMAVFISHEQFERTAAIVAAVEPVIAIPAYRDGAIVKYQNTWIFE